jgi:DNA repair exonuclease SbcCD nuclease subunit
MIRILCIGDQHFKPDNVEETDMLVDELDKFLQTRKYNYIISMGDLLHTNERIHSNALNRATKYLLLLSKNSETFVLVGNHDYINCSQFMTENHWLNCMKSVPNIHIVDKTIKVGDITMCPFVPDGRFIEALNIIPDWKFSKCIFGHQLIDGCKMGSIKVSGVEEWKESYPMLICGHVHDKQNVSDNLIYIGSALQESFGEYKDKSICEVVISEKISLNEHFLNIPKKKTIYISSDEIDSFVVPESSKMLKYRIVIHGDGNSFKIFIKSEKYKKIIENKNIKFDFKHSRKEKEERNKEMKRCEKNSNFKELLFSVVKEDKNLISIFDEFVKQSNHS